MAVSDHEFGGVSTNLKLAVVQKYLNAYTTALRGQFPQLWYIDAFAGTGERTVRLAGTNGDMLDGPEDERIERYSGSAQIAIDAKPAFDRLIFMEKKAKHLAALQVLRTNHPTRVIDILKGDANEEIVRLLHGRNWAGTRAVMFLDPYGMQVEWKTLEAIRATEAIDVWYLVSLSGMFRQAARDGRALDEGKRDALTRMLGTDEWEKAWYRRTEEIDLFGDLDEQHARVVDVDAMQAFMQERLKQLFPMVTKPLRLNDARGIPQFALFFAISNPEGRAIGLAQRIANHILNSGSASQVRP